MYDSTFAADEFNFAPALFLILKPSPWGERAGVRENVVSPLNSSGLVTEQLLQLLARRVFARRDLFFGGEGAAGQFEILAKVSRCLLQNGIGPAISALVGSARIITDTIQTNAQIGVATVAGISAAGLAGQSPFPAAIVTMSGSSH